MAPTPVRPVVALALTVALLVAGCAPSPSSPDRPAEPDTAAGRTGCVPLEVNSSTEKGDLLLDLAYRYNRAGRTFDGRCAAVSVHKTTSGKATDAVTAGWNARRHGVPVPQVWTPSSSLWLGLVEERTGGRTVLAPEGAPSLATSPLTIAMPRPMAEALGWPDKALGWADVLALASDRRGWAAHGHPEWGGFTLGRDNPHRSTSGLAATVATYYAATGRTADLSEADVRSAKAVDFVRGVEASVAHYSDDAVRYLSNLADADQRGQALSYLSAIVMQEQLAFLYNSGAPDANPKSIGTGRRPTVPLVAVHPSDGTLMFDHPYVVLPGASTDQRAAAADFLAFLRLSEQRQRFAEVGFRDSDGQPTKVLSDTLPMRADQQLTLLRPPSPSVLAAMLSGWDDLRKKARVLLVIDVSSSMSGSAGGGRTKLDAAKRAAIEGIGLLHPDDEVALWSFSSDPSYRQRLGFGRVGDIRSTLTKKIDDLDTGGNTDLYKTTRAAHKYVYEGTTVDRINAVVLLTDGNNTDNLKLADVVRAVDAERLELSVRMFAIAFGDGSDLNALRQIARAAKGSAYDARDPSTINDAFISVLSNF